MSSRNTIGHQCLLVINARFICHHPLHCHHSFRATTGRPTIISPALVLRRARPQQRRKRKSTSVPLDLRDVLYRLTFFSAEAVPVCSKRCRNSWYCGEHSCISPSSPGFDFRPTHILLFRIPQFHAHMTPESLFHGAEHPEVSMPHPWFVESEARKYKLG